ncbi:hypothetical protein F5B21DRAFT_516703 [Xylaria acuta]|nr:hypothetical protein F5B21DRAFT_516703 [Xylaria acuta]
MATEILLLLLVPHQGFETVKQLLQQTQPYRFILGARDLRSTQAAYNGSKYDATMHNLRGVKPFAQQTLDKLGNDKLDILFLNAGINKPATGTGPNGSKWREAFVVNHLLQHYLTHLFEEKLRESRSRIVVVSSGGILNIRDEDPTCTTDTLYIDLKADSGADGFAVHRASKFAQLLSTHWWRRRRGNSARVVISGHLDTKFGVNGLPDARSVDEGAKSILQVFTRDDFPSDPEQISLTSWYEWWPKGVYTLSLDDALQDKWSPSKEKIEEQEVILTRYSPFQDGR